MAAPLPATADLLRKTLDRRPVLWVGAGLSVAAGLPGTGRLVQAMVAAAEDPIAPDLPFEKAADDFVASLGEGALADLLQQELGESLPLTPVHRAIARAALDGCFAAIVTTNYDDLLERALDDAGVRTLQQVLEDNAVVEDDAAVRLLKLHGSRTTWLDVVLSGESYVTFSSRYPFLEKQLHVLLRRHPVLFVGCSLQDPRILGWLGELDDDAARTLKPWRALMTERAWEDALKAGPGLGRANLRPLLLDDHDDLPRLWLEAVPERPPVGEMVLDFEVGDGKVGARCGQESWEPENPIDDEALVDAIEELREVGTRPLPADDHGVLAPTTAGLASWLNGQAGAVGQRLTDVLADPVRQRLIELEAAARAGRPALLRVRVAAKSEADTAAADRLLALPWELLRLGDRFPVAEHTLDLVREAVVPGLPGLPEPDAELKVVATVAAPVDQTQLDHEDELYRLWRALGAQDEGRLYVADLGTLDDLAAAVKQQHPPVVHFSGHGTPGALVFEDDSAHAHTVAVGDLVKDLRVDDRPLPRLIYLSACHGTTAGASRTAGGDAGSKEAERMVDQAAVATQPSTAAALHRGGFAQVVGYFGPVGDEQATRTAAAFYAALAGGATARAAMRQARALAAKPLPLGDGWGVYPLGWAQLALYHRGVDRPTALPATSAAPLFEAPKQRHFVRIDATGGAKRVERRHDEPIVGVQQLRHGFIGRRAPRADAIRRWRRGQRVLVVQGLGGLGKTALCAELLRVLPAAKVLALDGRFAGAQPDPLAGLWQEVQAARPDDEQWSQLLAHLQRDGLSADALVQALQKLTRLEGSLIVYLDDAESLQEELQEATGLGRWRDERLQTWWSQMMHLAQDDGAFGVLASSRYRPAGTPEAAVLNLEPMSRWDTVRLMSWMPTLRRLPHADRGWLAEQLEGHPRTVEWLEVLAADKEQTLTPPGGSFTGSWRTQVLEPILEEAGEKVDADLLLEQVWRVLDDDAREHLGRATVLHQPTPWDAVLALAPDGATASGRRLIDAGLLSPFQSPEPQPWWAPHRLVSDTVKRLWQGDPLAAHRRVGEWFRQRFETKGTLIEAQRAVEHLCAGGDGDAAFPTARSLVLWLRVAGRYREALGWVDRLLAAGVSGPQLGLALMYQVQLLQAAGTLPADGEQRLLRALELVAPQNRGDVLAELGALCEAQGRLPAAASYLQEAVDSHIEDKSETSIDVAAAMHELARVLQAQGDLNGARTLLERSLQIKAAVFGTQEHPEVAASMHELARVLQAQGDLNGARTLLERSRQILVAVFGTEEHPSVATSMHQLASVLQAQGDLNGARTLLERSLQIKAAVFGTQEHPDVAASMHNLASVLQAQGDLNGAKTLLERSLQILAAVFGTQEHPSVAASMHELASVLQAQGDLNGARALLERSCPILVAVFGTEEHPDVAASMHELASVLQAQGDLNGARTLLERCLEIAEKVYGTREHYLLAIAEASLGFLYLKMDLAKEAVPLLEHALGVYQRQLGPDHPYTRQLAEWFAARE